MNSIAIFGLSFSCVFANMSVVDMLNNDVKVVDSEAAKSMDGIVDENISMVKIKESGENVARYVCFHKCWRTLSSCVYMFVATDHSELKLEA